MNFKLSKFTGDRQKNKTVNIYKITTNDYTNRNDQNDKDTD